jgi:hypothetical protein
MFDASMVTGGSIPDCLIQRTQWVGWKLCERDGKPTKVPISPHSGRPASTTEPSTWGTFQEAVDAAIRLKLSGIGYVFSKDDLFTGIDLDKCRDPETGSVEPWAQSIVDALNSYTEISPSDNGLHIIVEAALPDGRRRNGRVEMYSDGRYFTMTGNRVPGTPATVEPRQDELQAQHALLESSGTAFTRHSEASIALPETRDEHDDELKTVLQDNPRSVDLNFTVNPSANPPADKFADLLRGKPRFRQSWEHARNVDNNSLSSYDMSLAGFAYQAGWTHQEIVDLVVAHRRMYGDRTKLLRRDYHERMLKRLTEAKETKEAERLLLDADEQAWANGDQEKIFDRVNRILFPDGTHRITAVLQYTGEPTTYVIKLDDRMVGIGPIEHLTKRSSFRNVIADATRAWPRLPSEQAWDAFVRHMLSVAEVVETGGEATDLGVLELRLARFLSHEVASEEEWEEGLHAGTPFRYQGRTCFTIESLSLHISRNYYDPVSTKKLPVFLRQLSYIRDEIKYRPQEDKSRSTTLCVWYKP